MLTTETYELDDALDAVDDQISALDEALADLDESTDEYRAIQEQQDRLKYFRNGLRWQRDEEGWGNATVELGAMTAGEKALMHRTATDGAESDEMRLWFVAASTAAAPYAADDLEETFAGLADCHPGFAEWAEGKTNGLGVPSESGNRSSTSSRATEPSETSTSEPDTTTSSSSDSPTA